MTAYCPGGSSSKCVLSLNELRSKGALRPAVFEDLNAHTVYRALLSEQPRAVWANHLGYNNVQHCLRYRKVADKQEAMVD